MSSVIHLDECLEEKYSAVVRFSYRKQLGQLAQNDFVALFYRKFVAFEIRSDNVFRQYF